MKKILNHPFFLFVVCYFLAARFAYGAEALPQGSPAPRWQPVAKLNQTIPRLDFGCDYRLVQLDGDLKSGNRKFFPSTFRNELLSAVDQPNTWTQDLDFAVDYSAVEQLVREGSLPIDVQNTYRDILKNGHLIHGVIGIYIWRNTFGNIFNWKIFGFDFLDADGNKQQAYYFFAGEKYTLEKLCHY